MLEVLAPQMVTGLGDTAECWQLTQSLRWNGAVLEQAWQSLESGRLDWRAVPHVGPQREDSVPIPVGLPRENK